MKRALRDGLSATQKTLPSAYLYDDLGSMLFEAITLLPEYQVARVDFELLSARVNDLLATLAGPVELVELGPGHGNKARVVLEALTRHQGRTRFVAVDVSRAALHGCQRHLEDLSLVDVVQVEGTFVEGLRRAPAALPGHRRAVLFLGSNLSNFDRRESSAFFRDVRASLRPGDTLVLSTDLEKPADRLLPAYDDAHGVTAAFNKNVLARLNREYGAQFDLGDFVHRARWNPEARRIEMHLEALRAVSVEVPVLEVTVHLERGETIWTESSHRFSLAELEQWGREAGFQRAAAWTSEGWALGLSVFVA